MLLRVVLFVYLVLASCIADDKKYYYIYEWPEFFSDVWPPAGAELVPDTPYSHNFRSNITGIGQSIDPDIGYFNTWQFSLYKLAMARLLVDEHRTMDPAKATSFIVPFDIGVHSFLDHRTGKVRVASPHGWRAIEYFKQTMSQPVFNKNNFHDHFILFSVTSYQISGIGSKVFMCNQCQNCSVLTIETTPTNHARRYYSDAQGIPNSRKWWYAVPYPSSFHWWEGIKSPPWIQTPSSPKRKYTSIFIGSLKTNSASSNKLRVRLQTDCKKENETCLWFDAAHSCSGMFNNTDNMLLYRESTFCLAPPGDSVTRKSFFDSLLTGCIPVIFAKGTMSQYSWFVPPEVESIAVYISKQDVIEGTNFMTVLKSIPQSRIKEMQQRIQEIAPRLQYSIVPDGYGTPKSKVFEGDISVPPRNYDKGPVWKPPVPDAMDIIIEKILDRKTVEPMEGFTREAVLKMNTLRDDTLIHDPEYSGLNKNSESFEKINAGDFDNKGKEGGRGGGKGGSKKKPGHKAAAAAAVN